MKKFLTLLLAFSLLLGLFSACGTPDSSFEPSSEPTAEETTTYPADATKLMWARSDVNGESAIFTYSYNIGYAVGYATGNFDSEKVLFRTCVYKTDEVLGLFEEWGVEAETPSATEIIGDYNKPEEKKQVYEHIFLQSFFFETNSQFFRLKYVEVQLYISK